MEWLVEMTALFPRELIVAADVRGRRITARGWRRELPRDMLDAVAELNDLPLAGILITALDREGPIGGMDLPLLEDIAQLSDAPVIAAGPITTMNDLRALADRGVAATVIGVALHTGALDPRVVAEEFAE
jgi:phosphoribosylformimino-5-aminoimidazole carboxamide ribotide isomerase